MALQRIIGFQPCHFKEFDIKIWAFKENGVNINASKRMMVLIGNELVQQQWLWHQELTTLLDIVNSPKWWKEQGIVALGLVLSTKCGL